MTGMEIILAVAVMGLAAQLLILQSHYNEKLSEQAVVLDFLLAAVDDKESDKDRINQLRDKIFNSSQ